MTLTPAGIAGVGQDDLLAPEPAKLTGALVGYAWVPASGQNLDRQARALTEAGCIRVFADKLSGKTAGRPELAACLDYLRAGDTLVVPSLDRLSRSLQDLITMVAGLRRRGTGFRSLHEALDTTTSGGRLVFHVFAALAEFVRELIVESHRRLTVGWLHPKIPPAKACVTLRRISMTTIATESRSPTAGGFFAFSLVSDLISA